MTCFHPIPAFKTDSGEIVFREAIRYGNSKPIKLACGQCHGCRLERSRQWGTRCMHEAKMHNANCFITLTYEKEPYRNSLDYKHFQDFMKRLRKRTGVFLRFYMGGEYGEQNGRPHYHACIFGYDFPDKIYFSRSPTGGKLYRSETLEKCWPHGYSSIAEFNFQTACYVARYCMKKVTGPEAEQHYKRYDSETGEEYQLTPEFNKMSLKPGIGATWLDKYKKDVYTYDHVVVNGTPCNPPKYYDKILKRENRDKLEQFKELREERAIRRAKDNTHQRLAEKEEFQKARTKSLLRGKLK